MTQSTYTTEGENSAAIKADIERTRNQMSNKIDTIQERLNPETLKGQAQDAIRTAMRDGADSMMEYVRGHSGELGVSLVETVKRNPIPAALIGVGVGWLLLDGMSSGSNGHRRGADRWSAQRGYTPNYSANYGDTYRYGIESGSYGSRASYAGEEYKTYGTPSQWQEGYSYSDESNKSMGQKVREKVGEVTDTVRNKVSEIADQVSDKTSAVTGQIRHSTESWREEAHDKSSQWSAQAQGYTQRAGEQTHMAIENNVIAVSAAALVAGALIGLVLPPTRRENEMLGEWRDQLVEKAQGVASDVAQRAQEVVQEAKTDAQQIAANVVDELAQSGKEAIAGQASGNNSQDQQNKGSAANTPGTTTPAPAAETASKLPM